MTDIPESAAPDRPLRVLTLDGGGAKGFYTLGVLTEIEAMIGGPLHEKFDLIFGTSTGSIIASLIALGRSVDEILALYRAHVPTVMSEKTRAGRTRALTELAKTVFGDASFTEVKTGIGVVTARWLTERPMIFKASVAQAHGRAGNVNDVTQAAALLHGEENVVFADAGYRGVGKREEARGLKVDWQIAMRPGQRRALDLTRRVDRLLDKVEQLKASMRAKVEHPFRVVKQQFGYAKVCYRGLAKNTARLTMLFALSNLWMVRRQLLGARG